MNNNIIFLDIDGVLNSECFFIKRKRNMKNLRMININKIKENDKIVIRLLSNIDLDSFDLIKKLVDETNAKIVMISSLKVLYCFDNFCNHLINLGLPIIGKTYDNGNDRGKGIKKYLKENDTDEYIILDDDISIDYDDELLSHLIKTNFKDGLTEEEFNKALINLLNKNLIKTRKK